jgi:cytochrome c
MGMMRVIAWGLIVGSGMCHAQTPAVDVETAKTLVVQNYCNACHDAEKKMLGPAFKDIAAKYKGDPDASAKLFKKVKRGGNGVWGETPMPANEGIKDEDLKTILAWVLSL